MGKIDVACRDDLLPTNVMSRIQRENLRKCVPIVNYIYIARIQCHQELPTKKHTQKLPQYNMRAKIASVTKCNNHKVEKQPWEYSFITQSTPTAVFKHGISILSREAGRVWWKNFSMTCGAWVPCVLKHPFPLWLSSWLSYEINICKHSRHLWHCWHSFIVSHSNDLTCCAYCMSMKATYNFTMEEQRLLACGAKKEIRGSIPGLAATISEIGYLLLPSRDMAEISQKRRKSSKQQTNFTMVAIYCVYEKIMKSL